MAILKYANQSGTVYAYESISEWDPVKKQSRSKRKCLGRVDPDTGEIIPTSSKRGRPAKTGKDHGLSQEQSMILSDMEKLLADHEKLKSQNEGLMAENKRLKAILLRIKNDVADI